MANKKKKRKNMPSGPSKQESKEERERLSSDWSIGFVFLLIALCAAAVMILTHTIGASRRYNSADQNTSTIEEMPADAQAFEDLTEDDAQTNIYADITVENYGTITVKLDAEAAPLTVENFVELAKSGFYDGLTFHRIMDGFMMQGGDPTGTGTGDSGKNIKGEFSANGWDNPLSHTRGAISMARAKEYDSASCQFFICQEDCSQSLDGLYACFGYVTSGMEYVDAICQAANPIDDNGSILELDQPVISSIVIRYA